MRYLVLIILLLLPTTVLAHRYHTSLTRIDYNESEKLAEITIQVFTHDIEDGLTRKNGKRVTLDKTPKINEIILNYLSDRFVIRNKNDEAKKLRWIGIQQETDVTLIYVETEMPETFQGATLENGILQEVFSDQVNLATIRYDSKKNDLIFRANGEPQSLIKKEN